MCDDRIVGDGGNLTVYERPDESRYALDQQGRGSECEPGMAIFGRARFDAREEASGRWPGSRSSTVAAARPGAITSPSRSARVRGRRPRAS